MIEVNLSSDGTELGKIRIIKQVDNPDETADYSIEFAVDRMDAIGLHQRSIRNFPRLEFNVLGLLRAALMTLDEKELRLEDDIDSSDMARGFHRALPALPSEEESKLRNHRPSFWRRQ